MYKIKPFVNKSISRNLYFSIIHPHILYAIQVWGSAFGLYRNRILLLQKKAVRLLSDMEYYRDGHRLSTNYTIIYFAGYFEN